MAKANITNDPDTKNMKKDKAYNTNDPARVRLLPTASATIPLGTSNMTMDTSRINTNNPMPV